MLVGLIVPLAAGLAISVELEKKQMLSQLADFHQRSLETLVDSAEDAMLSFSPEGARNIASFLLQDERIVTI